jgi:hypothetical protein
MIGYLLLASVVFIWFLLLLGALFLLREGCRLANGKGSKHFPLSKWVAVEREQLFCKHLGRFIVACGVYLLSICVAIVVFQLPLKSWSALVITLIPITLFGRKWLDRKAKE